MLTRSRVTDGEAYAVVGEDDETFTGGLRIEEIFEPDERLEGRASGGLVIEGDEVFVAGAEFGIGDDGEAPLAGVVGLEEGARRGGAAPGAADGAATEERFRREADEDLPDDHLLREAAVETRRSCRRGHSRRRRFHAESTAAIRSQEQDRM
jgi:hypothetical protein